MKRLVFLFLAAIATQFFARTGMAFDRGAGESRSASISGATAGNPRLGWVDPLIGSGGWGFGAGSMTPAPQTPKGMIRPGPDTSFDHVAWPWQHFAGYWHEDTHIRGFSQTRLVGVGLNDQGVVRIMPTHGFDRSKTGEAGYRQRFFHDRERVRVGYYGVVLEPSGIDVEIAPGDRAALYRFTYPRTSEPPTVIVDAGAAIVPGHVRGAKVEVDREAREIRGVIDLAGGFSGAYGGLPTYFALRFSEPLADCDTFADGRVREGDTEASGALSGAYAQFAARDILVAVGISYIDVAHARAHIDEDLPGFDFDRTVARAREHWSKKIDLIEISGGTARQRRIFHTALYNAFRMPTLMTESGRDYRAFDGQTRRANDFTYHSDLSLWDTFRTVHPLYNLIDPDLNRDLVKSLVAMARATGRFPVWPMGRGDGACMIGTHADAVVAEAAVKGMRDEDLRFALHLMTNDARPDRDDADHYVTHGYCAADRTPKAVSKTLEYAFDDACVAALAKSLGARELANVFRNRSENYRHVWDDRTGYFRARRSDGSFTRPFRRRWVFDRDYVEGSAEHWRWYVPHDPEGLADLLGGRESAAEKLNRFFESGVGARDTMLPDRAYWHGNEPDIHAAYLFNRFGRPDLTQTWVRWIMENKYDDTPDGLDGNDDAGTLSTWYVWSAIGLYPLDPCSGNYELGTPLFPRAVLHLPDGDLVIVAENQAPNRPFVSRVEWNGAPLARTWVRHEEIRHGGELRFVMTSSPTGVDPKVHRGQKRSN
ncbi:MAG: GH92 family glycosyl hydrolase [Deltaproteobacteria bacterium]|nr:GH92 family glycosyl hydrolase [Deltaproteobacteria bacterium]